jgi:hypothetical protein
VARLGGVGGALLARVGAVLQTRVALSNGASIRLGDERTAAVVAVTIVVVIAGLSRARRCERSRCPLGVTVLERKRGLAFGGRRLWLAVVRAVATAAGLVPTGVVRTVVAVTGVPLDQWTPAARTQKHQGRKKAQVHGKSSQ